MTHFNALTPNRPMYTKREELMLRKIELDGKLAAAKIDFQEAEGLARADGKYVPPKEHAAMRRNIEYLARESQRLQFELRGDRKQVHAIKDQKGQLFMQEFFMVAWRTLSKEAFTAIAKEAEARLTDAAIATQRE